MIVSKDIENKAVELTDEEISYAAGGTGEYSDTEGKTCDTCQREVDPNSPECQNCDGNIYFLRRETITEFNKNTLPQATTPAEELVSQIIGKPKK
jgi:methionyl-tRNA synthetase